MFSSKSFIVSGLIFRSLIHFQFIFVCFWEVFSFHSFICCCPVFPAPFIEEAIGPIVYSCLVCQKYGTHRCMGLFLGFLSCSFVYISVFVPVPYCLDDYIFVVYSEVRKVDSSSCIIFCQDCIDYSGSLGFPYEL